MKKSTNPFDPYGRYLFMVTLNAFTFERDYVPRAILTKDQEKR